MQISLNNQTIALDHSKGDISFVSHAHSDHLNGVKAKEKIICSNETKLLAKLEGEIVSPDNIQLFEAGHMLGSKQIVLDTNEKRITYSGDIRLKDSILFRKAQIPQTDELIIEATYGDPFYKFPENEEVYLLIESWVKKNSDKILLIGGYEMGKAQELIKILNEYCSITPLVNENIARISDIYNQFGKKLDYIKIGTDEAEELMRDSFVAVVSPKHSKRYFAKKISDAFSKKTLCAFASGWTLKYKYNTDIGFPLSDHASFFDIKNYIEESSAKKVKFFCGESSHLEKEFKTLL
ncbi:MAG: MBL fold metallo-hydrolase [Candidatus Micrarchaeia archaeon]